MDKHKLSWHEKTLGQLFCDDKAPAVLKLLLEQCKRVGIKLESKVESIDFKDQYIVVADGQKYQSESLVIATGGPSIPKMGATDFGLQVARQFGIKTISFRPALVPFTFHQNDIDRYFKDLSGLSVDAMVSCKVCLSLIEASVARQFYKYPLIGTRVMKSVLIYCQT